jgi:hypothetical protein
MSYSLGHHKNSTLSFDLLKDNLSPVFLETGTNIGQGVLEAINAGFKKIVSIEIEPDFVEIVNNKFVKSGDYPDVEFQFHLGDSKSVIPNIIHDIDEKITFWLDGHEFYQIPLLEELIAIKNHKIKDHIIMIDDVRMFDSPEWNRIGHDNVIKLIMDINKSYKITYHNSPHGINDILIAKV